MQPKSRTQSNFMHIANTNIMKGAVHIFVCQHMYSKSGPQHKCPAAKAVVSLVLNTVLTGCVMWCAASVLQPGLGGSSTVGYSRVVIMKQLCSCSAGPV